MPRTFRNVSFYLLLIIVALSMINYFASDPVEEEKLDYSTFIQRVEAGEVERVVITNGNIEGEYVTGEKFTTYNPDDGQLVERLEAAGVTYTGEEPPSPPWWTTLFSTMLPILLLIGVWIFIMQQSQGGGNRVMQFGKSRARQYSAEERTRVTFNDVAGSEEAKEELQEIVEFLKEPKRFVELGARIPKGVLLVGPPGTGKTLLAKAVAGEADVPFFSISGSDFVEMFVGVGASRVRDLFDQAKKSAPCLVFMDELDAVGRQRGAGLGGGHDEREQTLNQLLVEMDGFGVNEGVIILAATNRPDVLDPALLRPGRFDRQVTIDQPDVMGREAILRVHLREKPVDNTVEVEALARATPGFTGADLANMVNEAALLTARRHKRRVSMEEMEEAMERIIAGPERKSRVISERERRLVAYHEGGHALLGLLLPSADQVHKVSIIPRGRAGGYTLSLPREDRYYITRTELLDRITQLLGGRVAEDLSLGEVSTGAQNDLERATQLVRKMIMEYGMSDRLGPLTFGHKQEQVFLGRDIARDRNYSEEIASAIDQEVRRLIDECYEKATRLLGENQEQLDLLAETLLEKETLQAGEIQTLLEEGNLDQPEQDAAEAPSEKEQQPEQPLTHRGQRRWVGKPQEGLS